MGHTHPGNLSRNLQISKYSLLKSRKGLLSGLHRKLLPIKRTSGYSKTRRHHGREMDSDFPKSLGGTC
ncbi:hypothetical protein Goarm_005714 [Gossypium armourianum]|uniref:Uncharacterized protein n=1 Tax=Gossypium armourianum TaxID=34283 RepID=A0A7J9KF57_9ROSI|nr:hypothetical protein [Gossypium armourianum]